MPFAIPTHHLDHPPDPLTQRCWAVPVLEIVTLCAALVVPVFWLPKESEVGEAESVALGELEPTAG